jgi:hypothetical protein
MLALLKLLLTVTMKPTSILKMLQVASLSQMFKPIIVLMAMVSILIMQEEILALPTLLPTVTMAPTSISTLLQVMSLSQTFKLIVVIMAMVLTLLM